MKIILIIIITTAISIGGYFIYDHYYVETLMLSEVVGDTENELVNILVSLGDFDTGLTRHDINNLKSNKDYWIRRMNEVNSIQDPYEQEQANLKLLEEMMDDPTMKKVCKIIKNYGIEL